MIKRFILVILLLVLGLLYVGGFLFFGEWLFGSMGWGIIHGTLLGAAFIGFVGINLAGGDVRAYGAGAAVGLVVTVLLAAVLMPLSSITVVVSSYRARTFEPRNG